MQVFGAVAVPFAPAIAEGVLAIATLGLVLVFLVCLGLREGWDRTIGRALLALADDIRDVSIGVRYVGHIHPFGRLADGLEWVAESVSHLLAVAALEAEQAAVGLWHLTARVFHWAVAETKQLAAATFGAVEHVITVSIPDAARWARREAAAVAHRLTEVEAAARRAADRAIGAVAHRALAEAAQGVREAEHALDWSEAQVGHINAHIRGLTARLARLEKQLLTAAGVAALVLSALDRLGLKWLRCGNTRKAGERLCGLNGDLLDALLVGTLAVGGAVSLTGLAHELVDLSDEIVPALTGFVSELGAVPQRTAAEQGFA